MKQVLFLFGLFTWSLSGAHAFSFSVPQQNNNAIYGSDKRQFITDKTQFKYKELSSAVAMVVAKDQLLKNVFSAVIYAPLLSDPDALNVCPDERFAKNHSAPSCSAFLIAEDLMVSAGHCFMTAEDCQNNAVVFDVLTKRETSSGFKVPAQNIFECKELVKSVSDSDQGVDYSIIRLKKKTHNRTVLKLSKKVTIDDQSRVFMIGHPLGLAQVLTNEAPIIDNRNEHFFTAALNSFSGNSGSPVFNSRTLEVEGVLVRGQEDLLLDSKNQCYRYQVYDQKMNLPGSSGEGITRVSAFRSH